MLFSAQSSTFADRNLYTVTTRNHRNIDRPNINTNDTKTNRKMINIFRLLRGKRFDKYTVSSRAEIYEEIAAEHRTTPQHVYELAHGLTPMGTDDSRILESLKHRKIIYSTHWYPPTPLAFWKSNEISPHVIMKTWGEISFFPISKSRRTLSETTQNCIRFHAELYWRIEFCVIFRKVQHDSRFSTVSQHLPTHSG